MVDLSLDNSTTSSLHPKMMAQLGTINVEDNEPDAPRRKRPHQLKNKLSRTIFHPLPCQSHTVHHHVPQIQSITTPTIANITPMHPRLVGCLPLNGQSRKSACSGDTSSDTVSPMQFETMQNLTMPDKECYQSNARCYLYPSNP